MQHNVRIVWEKEILHQEMEAAVNAGGLHIHRLGPDCMACSNCL